MTTLNNPTPSQPEKNPNRRFTVWAAKEIYTGPNGSGAYVPNQYDLVWNRNLGWYEVSSVDYTTGLAVLSAINIAKFGLGATEADALLSIGPGAATAAFVLLVDTSVVPHVAKFDPRFYIPGSEAAYVKIFKGADNTSGGNVISAMFNSAGAMTSENIPLENFYLGTNLKRPITGYLNQDVGSGELVTVAIYDRDGTRSGTYRLVVSLTDSVRDLNADFSYITGIELISDFMSKSDAGVLEIPQNMNLEATMVKGRVHRLGKPPIDLPVDGSKFNLYGMDAFVASIPNQEGDLVLTYKLDSSENAYNATSDGILPREYRIRTTDADLRYTLKLFAVPVWNSVKVRWKLTWYLYNLDRSILYAVTDKVVVATGSVAYDGDPANKNIQNIQMAINWQNVAAGNGYNYHVENLKIKNNMPATEALAVGGDASLRSYVNISYSDSLGYFGENASARISAGSTGSSMARLNIANGYLDLMDWLDAFYYELLPLYIDTAEFQAPEPTHVRLICDGFYRVIPIEDVLNPINSVNIALSPSPQGKTLIMQFIQQNGLSELELAIGYMVLQHVVA
jgi:hypothetical protein